MMYRSKGVAGAALAGVWGRGTVADLGGLGGSGNPPPPGCPKKFFFGFKIRKRNKPCAVHCTVNLYRVS